MEENIQNEVIDTSGSTIGVSFDFLKSEDAKKVTAAIVPVEQSLPAPKKKKTKRINNNEVVVADKQPQEINSYIETYEDTNALLHDTIGEINYLAKQLNEDLNEVRRSRTLKGKYTYICNMNSALSSLMATKITAIREQNNSIKNANDMDYKRQKDNKAADLQNDDKIIMDMYNSFVNAPIGQTYQSPSTQGMTLGSPSIITATAGQTIEEAGYESYIRNMTPEQNMMRLENNPNVQNVVVWDQATGRKYFAVYDTSTNTPVPNTVPRDQMFIEDTTIDERNMIAKNINLNEVYPLVIINKQNYNEY